MNNSANSNISVEVIAVVALVFCVGVVVAYTYKAKKRVASAEIDLVEPDKQTPLTNDLKKNSEYPKNSRKYQSAVLAIALYPPDQLLDKELYPSISDHSKYQKKEVNFQLHDFNQNKDSYSEIIPSNDNTRDPLFIEL
jgi:hypothetical protein